MKIVEYLIQHVNMAGFRGFFSQKNSGVHPRVSTLIQPSFQKKTKEKKVE